MSQILALPRLSFPVSIYSNESWNDAWGYFDGNNAPVPGTGIALFLMLRLSATTKPLIVASNTPGLIGGLPQNGSIGWGGANGNLIIPNIPVATIAAIPVGGPYPAEVLGVADGYQRVLAAISFTQLQGINR